MIERLAAPSPASWPALLSSLRRIGEAVWNDFVESVNLVDRVLTKDSVYSGMDFETRDCYRAAIAAMARHSDSTEREIAEAAMALAEEAGDFADAGRSVERRRTHVGYYLVDRGLSELRMAIGYRPAVAERLRNFVLRHATALYLSGIELGTFLIVAGMLSGLGVSTPLLAGCAAAALPATQAAVDFMNNLATLACPAAQRCRNWIFRTASPRLRNHRGGPHAAAERSRRCATWCSIWRSAFWPIATPTSISLC